MERIDVAVVGGGVVGLATACAVAQRGHDTCLFEVRPRPGLEASTHNSGVIHAGLYVEGRERMYRCCSDHDVPHARCGKLVVATPASEITALEALAARAHANGVEDAEIVDRAFLRRHEPHVEGVAAVWSPSTGIVEAEALVRSLRKAASRTVHVLPDTRVTGGAARTGGIEIQTNRERLLAGVVVNAAGLYADDV